MPGIRRRDFVGLLGGAAAAWPVAARAQQDRVRRIGVLVSYALDNPESQLRATAIQQGLEELGWREGQNIRIDYRWAAGDVALFPTYAKELVALSPDVLVANSTPSVAALREETRTIPIVFVVVNVVVNDPVGQGFVESLARPGGNITGFSFVDNPMVGKWLELLKQVAPRVSSVALLFNPNTANYYFQFLRMIEPLTLSLGMKLRAAPVRDPTEIEHAISELAREPNGALIGAPDPFTIVHRTEIMRLAMERRLPAIYGYRYFATEGGLMSYGADTIDLFRRTPSYIDRILRGANVGELPVQTPIKFELVINGLHPVPKTLA